MIVQRTRIAGLLVIQSGSFEDPRGFFRETYRASALKEALGRDPLLQQGNHSRSRAGVLRGFHTEAWDKLVYVVRGTALCVVADTRPGSTTFGTHERFLLGDAPGQFSRIYVSVGLSNAFYCLTDVDYINDVSSEFDPQKRGGVIWNDPTLGVDWPERQPILSEADRHLPTLRALFPEHPLFSKQTSCLERTDH